MEFLTYPEYFKNNTNEKLKCFQKYTYSLDI